jgi:hypothetical protein
MISACHLPGHCAYDKAFTPLRIFKISDVYGGERLSLPHWLGTWRVHFDGVEAYTLFWLSRSSVRSFFCGLDYILWFLLSVIQSCEIFDVSVCFQKKSRLPWIPLRAFSIFCTKTTNSVLWLAWFIQRIFPLNQSLHDVSIYYLLKALESWVSRGYVWIMPCSSNSANGLCQVSMFVFPASL